MVDKDPAYLIESGGERTRSSPERKPTPFPLDRYLD